MLECKNLIKKYRNKAAVDDLSLQLETGRIYALLGPNGSGKTTFMKIAAGLVKPTSGEIFFEQQPIGVFSKSQVAYMPTEAYFYTYMTGKDVGLYYQDFFEDFSMEKYSALLSTMDLDPSQKVSKMSSGMMAKLKIAVTLSRNAKLIMLDEPLNGIDIIARDRIIRTILDSFTPEKTFVLSSHLVDELEKVIDHAIFIKNGRLMLEGDAELIRQEHGKSIVDMYKEIYAEVVPGF
ncbi:MAG: ABC transporter ATP-binding protein [Lachnospiraceae bacterium]|nr:ABC transporter ATP-binding protein [Lachnospiraceae bacterium]